MSQDTGGSSARDLCWHCEAQIGGEYFCQTCIKIQPIRIGSDYFQCLGLPRRLNIDLPELEKRYYDLSRKFHPDYFQQRLVSEQEISLENSAVINKAYR